MLPYPLTVTITNATDPQQNARIKTIAGVFIYSDGSNSDFGGSPRNNLDLGVGQSASYDSNGNCVVEYFFYVTVSESGDEITLPPTERDSQPGCCLTGKPTYNIQV